MILDDPEDSLFRFWPFKCIFLYTCVLQTCSVVPRWWCAI